MRRYLIWIIVLLFYINLCVNLLNMFTKDELKLEMVSHIALISYLIFITVLLFYINLCVNLLNMFTKDELKLEMVSDIALI